MDLASATNLNNFITNAELLSSFNAPKNISVSFKDFTYSIKLGHDDLMTIINNLSIVSTTQTLTLGRTNLAKLTTDEIQILHLLSPTKKTSMAMRLSTSFLMQQLPSPKAAPSLR